jgi:hypothetical protein
MPAAAAKRPGSVASFRPVRRTRARVSNAGRSANPGHKTIAGQIGSGVGGFVAGNLGAFVLKKVLANKLASFQRALGPVGGALVFGGLWYGTKKLNFLKKYRIELLVGSGVAVLQHTLAALVPGLAWLGGGAKQQAALPAPQPTAGLPPGAVVKNGVRYVIPGEIENERAEEQIRNGTWGKARYAEQDMPADANTDGAESPPDDPDGDWGAPTSDEARELEQWDREEEAINGEFKGGIF